MFVILVYDVSVSRVSRIRKIACKYLIRVQESVFEGYLTERRLKQLRNEIYNMIHPLEDSVILYIDTPQSGLTKEQLGKYPSNVCHFL